MTWRMFLTSMHHWYLDWKRKILQIGCLILINVLSPLDVSLKELGIGPRIHWTEVGFITILLGVIHLLTRISQTTIVNLSLIIVKTLENYGMCCEKPWVRSLKWHLYCIVYLYSAQYLHILQDSKRYLTNLTAQVQPQLTSNWHSPNWKIEAQGWPFINVLEVL